MEESILFPDLSLFESEEEEDKIPHEISLWTKTKLGTFLARLETLKAFVERRNRNAVILARVLIAMANETFGFDGWSSSVMGCCCVAEKFREGFYTIEQRATVRVTFRDGSQVDAEGMGVCDSVEKAPAYGTSKKMAVCDGLRNAIMLLSTLLPE